jgi:dTDP-glucose 4,6-dehydratase
MRVIVTGGAGFIGSALVRHLVLDKGYDVLNVDALTYAGNLASLRAVEGKANYRFLKPTSATARRWSEAVAEFRPDRIMHLAAESHVDRSITGAADFIQTNIIGTFTLLETARAIGRRSRAPRRTRSASSTSRPTRSMARSATRACSPRKRPTIRARLIRRRRRRPTTSPRRGSGPTACRSWSPTARTITGLITFPEKLIPLTSSTRSPGERLPVYGKGENVRDWLYVEDHARALDTIAERGRVGETYNVGGRNERRNIDVVETICDVLDEFAPADRPRAELIEFVTDRPGHDARYAIDATKLEHELGWRAQENFDSGIAKTVQWYLDNEWWWQPLRERYSRPAAGAAQERPRLRRDADRRHRHATGRSSAR